MQVPFVDLKTQYQAIKNEVDSAIGRILEDSVFILGNAVREFEGRFAKAHEVQYCAGLSSGTDGNHTVLWGLGLSPGDEVIVPANTFIATAWGATLCGAKPVFVDCEDASYNVDPKKVEAAITTNTKAIVAVHLYGQAADMDPLNEIAQRRKIALVEDCAQSHLAEYKGRKVGGLSAAASFSFYPGKNLGAYGEAGAVTTNDPELARKFRLFRDHGAEEKYQHEIYGHNYRMEAIQGAVLNVKLSYLEEWTERRRKVAGLYDSNLQGVGDVLCPREMPYAKHVYHLYVIQTQYRDRLQKFLHEHGISTGLHYPIPLHLQKCFSHLGYRKGNFPVTEQLADRCLSLPMFPEMTVDQVDYVVEKVNAFFKL